jgi:hypothetical protein
MGFCERSHGAVGVIGLLKTLTEIGFLDRLTADRFYVCHFGLISFVYGMHRKSAPT